MKMRHFAVVILMLGAATVTLEWQKGVFGVSVLSTTARTADEPDEANDESSSSETTSRPDATRLVDQIAVRLLEEYGKRIANPAVQVSLLAEKKALIEKHPEDGVRLFREAVAVAFPDRAETILERVAKMAQYRDWEERMYVTLNDMGLLARSGKIWEKRRELFGDAASLIWADEKQALVEKRQAVQDKLDDLDQADTITLDETLYQLERLMETNYEAQGLDSLGQPAVRQTMATTFFSLGAVQEKLAAMPADARQSEINRLRQRLGYSDEAIKKLEKRDRERNKRWNNGNEYMAERETLSQRYSGKRLEKELSQLRETYFGFEAPTIAREEENGFFRYNRERVFGRN